MAKQLPPIEDYYGTEISVQAVGHSAGFMVDLERRQSAHFESFDSLTSDQARDLANRLNQAADEIEGAS
jgi:hypothetical protein